MTAHALDDYGRYHLNHHYYGMVDPSVTAWSVEHIEPNTEEAARELASRAEAITQLVEQQAGATQDGADSLAGQMAHGNEAQRMGVLALGFMFDVARSGKPRLRLDARRNETGRWVISDYDFGAWTALL